MEFQGEQFGTLRHTLGTITTLVRLHFQLDFVQMSPFIWVPFYFCQDKIKPIFFLMDRLFAVKNIGYGYHHMGWHRLTDQAAGRIQFHVTVDSREQR